MTPASIFVQKDIPKQKKKKEERNNNAMRVILNKAFRSIVYLVRWHFSR